MAALIAQMTTLTEPSAVPPSGSAASAPGGRGGRGGIQTLFSSSTTQTQVVPPSQPNHIPAVAQGIVQLAHGVERVRQGMEGLQAGVLGVQTSLAAHKTDMDAQLAAHKADMDAKLDAKLAAMKADQDAALQRRQAASSQPQRGPRQPAAAKPAVDPSSTRCHPDWCGLRDKRRNYTCEFDHSGSEEERRAYYDQKLAAAMAEDEATAARKAKAKHTLAAIRASKRV